MVTGPEGEAQVFDLDRFGGPINAIANADDPSHIVHRKLILPHVTPAATAALEDTVREWAVELIAPLVEEGGGTGGWWARRAQWAGGGARGWAQGPGADRGPNGPGPIGPNGPGRGPWPGPMDRARAQIAQGLAGS